MRIVILFLMINSIIFAAEVQLTTDKIIVDEVNLKSRFVGNVVIIKGEDKLTADIVTIDFDKQREPLKYEANGNVSVEIIMNKKRYHANGDNLLYDVILNRYTLTKNAFLEEINTSRKIYGDTIVVDQNSGTYTVDGSLEPAKFIFQIDDKKREDR
ncbi:MAG: lipopolysaccharide transport periplasmic protein LptA [Campylobacteraceae bacterium]|jgi:lipopolysaccharide export system protein LptA|nr:lipopolysaccharide transport periplasmic protein LptA [Campylobacteraceae bacterium]